MLDVVHCLRYIGWTKKMPRFLNINATLLVTVKPSVFSAHLKLVKHEDSPKLNMWYYFLKKRTSEKIKIVTVLIFWVVTPCRLFKAEHGESMFLQNVGIQLLVNTASNPEEQYLQSCCRETLKFYIKRLVHYFL